MVKNKNKSCECPQCGVKYQTWVELDGKHETYNSFAFIDYKAPIYLEKCTACWQAESKEDGEEQKI